MTTDELIARDALYRWLGEHLDVPRDSDFSEWIAGWIDAQRASEDSVQPTITGVRSALYTAGWRHYSNDAMIDESSP